MGQTEMLHEIFKLIKKVSLGLDNHEKCTLVSLGLSPYQSMVVSEIDRDFSFTHTILSKRCSISKSTLSEALKAMEQKGLIERVKCRADKRKSYINLTPRGKTVRKALLYGDSCGEVYGITDMTQLEIKLLYILLKKLEYQLGTII
jgi:DNA-binding MarR family transcriptional regulator